MHTSNDILGVISRRNMSKGYKLCQRWNDKKPLKDANNSGARKNDRTKIAATANERIEIRPSREWTKVRVQVYAMQEHKYKDETLKRTIVLTMLIRQSLRRPRRQLEQSAIESGEQLTHRSVKLWNAYWLTTRSVDNNEATRQAQRPLYEWEAMKILCWKL